MPPPSSLDCSRPFLWKGRCGELELAQKHLAPSTWNIAFHHDWFCSLTAACSSLLRSSRLFSWEHGCLFSSCHPPCLVNHRTAHNYQRIWACCLPKGMWALFLPQENRTGSSETNGLYEELPRQCLCSHENQDRPQVAEESRKQVLAD